MGKLPSDLTKRNVPIPQERPLVHREVFVQQIQAKAGSELFRAGRRAATPYRSSNASCASRTASATALNGMRPPQRVLQMKSHDRPSATSSNTCHTMIRVPLNVGLPWQISGSATMYRPNSTRGARCLVSRCLPFFMLGTLCAV